MTFYVCGGDTVIWQADPAEPGGGIASFVVDFQGRNPFKDSSGGLYSSPDATPRQSGTAVGPCPVLCSAKVFKYKVTVCYDKACVHKKEFDPRGIIMGGG